jgi:hypothetical protein
LVRPWPLVERKEHGPAWPEIRNPTRCDSAARGRSQKKSETRKQVNSRRYSKALSAVRRVARFLPIREISVSSSAVF